MDTTFTQGKWIATTTPDLSLFVCLDDVEHTVLASLNSVNPYDAKLMAAAPELLHELLGFVNSLTSSMRNRNTMLTINHGDLVSRIDSARAAIAKALGK